jgi:hypothetical protein
LLFLDACCGPAALTDNSAVGTQFNTITNPVASYNAFAAAITVVPSADPQLLAVSQPYFDLVGQIGVGRVFLYNGERMWGIVDQPDELTGKPRGSVLLDECVDQANSGLSEALFGTALAGSDKYLFVSAPRACIEIKDASGQAVRAHIGRVYKYDVADPRFPRLIDTIEGPTDPGSISYFGGFGDFVAANTRTVAISNPTLANLNLSAGVVYISSISAAGHSALRAILPARPLDTNWAGTFGRHIAVTDSRVFISEERYAITPSIGPSFQNIVHVYDIASLIETATMSDPDPDPTSQFAKWFVVDGGHVYTGGHDVIYALESEKVAVFLKRPASLPSWVGASFAISAKWVAVSDPYADPFPFPGKPIGRGYIVVFLRSDLSKAAAVYSTANCKTCFGVVGYPGVDIAIAGNAIYASDPAYIPYVDAARGRGAIYTYKFPAN